MVVGDYDGLGPCLPGAGARGVAGMVGTGGIGGLTSTRD